MPDLDYGPKISQQEYEQACIELIRSAAKKETPAQAIARERAEFFLLVDYRLGTQVPAQRRQLLWEARQRVLRTSFWHLFKGALRGQAGDGLSEALIKEFSTVLPMEEVQVLLRLDHDKLLSLQAH